MILYYKPGNRLEISTSTSDIDNEHPKNLDIDYKEEETSSQDFNLFFKKEQERNMNKISFKSRLPENNWRLKIVSVQEIFLFCDIYVYLICFILCISSDEEGRKIAF